MNIGIYLDTVDFAVPSHYRFHSSVLEGLARQNSGRHNFIVLTRSNVEATENKPGLKFVALQDHSSSRKRWARLKRRLASSLVMRAIAWLAGPACGLKDRLVAWGYTEPGYFAQLRELRLDVIWHITGSELPSPLPSIRTVLDLNHRLHPEYWPKVHFYCMEAIWSSIRESSFLIAGTNEGKRQIVSLYNVDESRIRVIPFPTPILPDCGDAPPGNLGFDGPYIFFPARFWRHKNHVVAVAALKVLRDKWNIRIHLVFSGKGSSDQEIDGNNLSYVMNYAKSLGVLDQIRHVGEVSIEELTALYKHAFALTFVSATGPDNLPPLEAMSVGCPAIVADVPGAREQYGDACLFYPTMDENALADHIKFLMENPHAREELIAKGYARAKKWTVDDYGREILELFDEFALIARAWGCSADVYKTWPSITAA